MVGGSDGVGAEGIVVKTATLHPSYKAKKKWMCDVPPCLVLP